MAISAKEAEKESKKEKKELEGEGNSEVGSVQELGGKKPYGMKAESRIRKPQNGGQTPTRCYTPRVMQVFVIVPAAGLGTRMAGPQPKQFLELDGVPILVHSLRAFAAVPRVTAIYVAARKTEMERVETQVAEAGFAGRAKVVEGGEKRQESVAHALAALPADPDDIVLVHDAVRPLIDAATIERTIDAVIETGAAIVGLPALDTIKQVERTAHGALITATIPREFVVLAQTPQGFRYGMLQRAFAEAEADGFAPTRPQSWSAPDFLSPWYTVLRLI